MNDTIRSLLERRSVRSYQPKQVPDDVLAELLRVGLTAPSAVNRQPWHVSVVRDAAAIETMMDAIRDYHRAAGSPNADDPGFHTFYHAPTVLYVSSEDCNRFGVGDCANLVTYLAVAAHALGLASCYIASSQVMFQTAHAGELRRLLDIPDGFSPVFSLAVGYMAGDAPEPKPRREGTVSYIG